MGRETSDAENEWRNNAAVRVALATPNRGLSDGTLPPCACFRLHAQCPLLEGDTTPVAQHGAEQAKRRGSRGTHPGAGGLRNVQPTVDPDNHPHV